jgi:beta-galactosidase GanA
MEKPAKDFSVFDDPDSHQSDKQDFLSSHDPLPHTENVVNIVETLIHRNVPFGVITKENLDDLSRYKVIVLSNAKMMNTEEAEAIRAYVKQGGCIYASRYTSLYPSDGTPKTDFQLSDVFGVSYKDTTAESVTYISPVDDSNELFDGYSQKYPVSVHSTQAIVSAAEEAEVLATVKLPYTNPKDPSKFVSIHCNPPGIATENPAVVVNSYGQGKSVYVATELENQELHRDLFWKLIRQMLASPLLLESNAPKPVEFTTFVQEDKKRYIINACNFQKDMPSVPVSDITVTMNLSGKKVVGVKHMPQESNVDYQYSGDSVTFVIPRLEVFEMYAVYIE